MASIMRALALMLITLTVAACSSGRREDGESGADTSSSGMSHAGASLENTYWKLVMLGDKPVTTPEGGREAQMTLSSEGKSVGGFSGCNGFSGTYSLDGGTLKFGSIISTKMACVNGMEVETGFFSALSATTTYAITGRRLELFDATGKSLARFDSVPMR